MALSSRPNARVGLPSSPAPRSRSLIARAPRQDIPPRPSSAASERPRTERPIPPLPNLPRHQRSLVDLNPSYTPKDVNKTHRRIARIPPPPLPDVPAPAVSTTDNIDDPTKFYEYRKGSNVSISSLSSSSSSSSASSLFSSKSPLSSASSSTSLDDQAKENGEKTKSQPVEGFGTLLWNRVATVAGSLTVSVTKALETGVATYNGETTPIGEESRLTRAMKEYYIAKARDPSDLPDWLFEDRDRGIIGRLRVANATAQDEEETLRIQEVKPPSAPNRQLTPSYSAHSSLDNIKAGGGVNMQGQTLRKLATKRSVRFVEQVHPRQRAISERQAKAIPFPPSKDGIQPRPVVTDSAVDGRGTGASRPRTPVKLPNVDIRGRRPSARGLPSGVRPQRG